MSTPTTGSRPRPGLIAFSVLCPPITWAVHLTVSYPLTDVACAMGSRLIFHVITAVAVVLIVAAGMIGWRRRSGSPMTDPQRPDAVVASNEGFLAWAAILLSAIFLTAVAVAHMGVLMVDPCLH